MRKLLVIAGLALTTGVVAVPAQAQVKFATVLNWGDDADLGLGAKLNFGIANALERSISSGSSGMPLYSAPEQLVHDPHLDHRVDIYALGAVIVNDARTSPAEHKKFVAAEIEKWGPVIKAAGQYAD